MRGYHDIGGLPGERVSLSDDPWAPWAKQFEAIRSLLGDGMRRLVTLDELRRAYETYGEQKYNALPFYERRLEAMLYILDEKGVIRREELERRIASGTRARRNPRFAAGDVVRVLNLRKTGHIRTPHYIRYKVGIVAKYIGSYLNPEDLGFGRTAGPVVDNYRIGFRQRDVWPNYKGNRQDNLYIEIYDHWLELA